jgi:hypothetical protein
MSSVTGSPVDTELGVAVKLVTITSADAVEATGMHSASVAAMAAIAICDFICVKPPVEDCLSHVSGVLSLDHNRWNRQLPIGG